MENKDFDKIFAHKFKQIPGEPYREDGWSDVSGRMDAYERRRRRWIFPVLLPLFGLLTAGNVFWWYQWRELTKQNKHNVTLSQSDTIVRTSIVYRYDTIYQNTTLVRRYTAGETSAVEGSIQPENLFRKSSPAKSANSDTPAAQQQPIAKTTPALPGTKDVIIQDSAAIYSRQNVKNKQLAQENPTEPAHTTSYRVPLPDSLTQTTQAAAEPMEAEKDSTFEYLLNHPPIIEKVRKPLLTFSRPRLGLSVGWGNPLLEHKRSGYLFGTGLGADVEIARHIRLGTEVQYWQGKLKADEIEYLKGVEIPDPGSDYKLQYWETYRITALTYAFQLRYLFPAKKEWTPWVGIGTQGATFLPFEIEFDFENQNNQLEIFERQAEAITHWHGLLFLAGIEKQISPHFSFGAEGFWLRHMGKTPGILDHQIGLKTRLYYNF